MRKVINISVSERLYKEVEEAVRQNKYETKSELFRDLLRAWKEGRFAKSIVPVVDHYLYGE